MSISKRIIFDKEVLDMVKSLAPDELKDEITKTDKMLDEKQDEVAELLAYKDLLYREVWGRTDKRITANIVPHNSDTTLKLAAIQEKLGITVKHTCPNCVYFDKLLSVCFHNSSVWKPIWDETEWCDKWSSKFEH